MDGVLVDSERLSVSEDLDFFTKLFDRKIAREIGDATGISINDIYTKAVAHGAVMSKELYLQKSDERAASIYARAQLTEKSDRLVAFLASNGYRLGLVSASARKWIDEVLARLSFRNDFEVIISIYDASDLRSKPAPDGFLTALRRLNAGPRRSIVLEDSNAGIQAGKAAGCYVIGYRGNLTEGYEQTGADAYADTMTDVIKLVEKIQSTM